MKALQNGSDIRGIAISTEEKKANLTASEVEKIAVGILSWLRDCKQLSKKLTIGIGHDSRISADELKESLIKTFTKYGVEVLDFGLATTPAMFMATQFPQYDCDATIMITASHLPYYFNGLKLFTKEGGAEKEDIAYILSHTKEPDKNEKGLVKQVNILTDYSLDLVDKIRKGIGTVDEKPLTGFHIIVDAGNGAGGFFAASVLAKLGADTQGSQFLDPDGTFPNHIPNPDNKEAMESIKQAVVKHQADLGVIFDTDVDRSAVVDASGNVINRNNLIAVLASIVLKNNPQACIVTNSPTSSHLKEFIESQGGKQIRYISGYRNVINKMNALNDSGVNTPSAIETSGHAAFKENYSLDDGAYVIAKILMLLPQLKQEGRTLSDLIDSLGQPQEVQEIRFPLLAPDFRSYGETVIADLEQAIQKISGFTVDDENHEGIRVNVTQEYGNGWFLLRLSLHEPLLVLQVENDQLGMNRKVLTTLYDFFARYSQVNSDKLVKALE